MIHLVRFVFEHQLLVVLIGSLLTTAPIAGIMILHSTKDK